MTTDLNNSPPVYPNFAPPKGGWDGSILNIPGLVPVNIGSPNPYPVPFQAPHAAPPQPVAPMPTQTYNAAPQGAGSPQMMSPAGASYQDGYGTIPSMQNIGDAPFALMGFNGGFGGYGSPAGRGGFSGGGGDTGGGSSFGFAPSYDPSGGFYASTPGGSPVDPMAGWRPGDVTSMPLAPIGQGQSSRSNPFETSGGLGDLATHLGLSLASNFIPGGGFMLAGYNAASSGLDNYNSARDGTLAPQHSWIHELFNPAETIGGWIGTALGNNAGLRDTSPVLNNPGATADGYNYPVMDASQPPPAPPTGVIPAQGASPLSRLFSGGGGGGGFQTSYGDPNSFGGQGNMLDTFMNGATFGGPGWGYGGGGGDDAWLSQASAGNGRWGS